VLSAEDEVSVKHQPATPLPWSADDDEIGSQVNSENVSVARLGNLDKWVHDEVPDPGELDPDVSVDAAYIAHAANAYPKLVAALDMAFSRLSDKAAREEIAALLLELGEKQ
jgi:hypothetical protein